MQLKSACHKVVSGSNPARHYFSSSPSLQSPNIFEQCVLKQVPRGGETQWINLHIISQKDKTLQHPMDVPEKVDDLLIILSPKTKFQARVNPN